MTLPQKMRILPDMDLPRTFLLLRHGQTPSNAGGVIQGHLPVPLNDLGRQQAILLARRLSDYDPKPQLVLTSDLVRTMQTARPIAAALRIPLVPDPTWRERGFGDFEGQTIGQRETWAAVSGAIDPPGAEPIEDFHARSRDALRNLVSRFPQFQTIAIVTHGGPIRCILQAFIDGLLPLRGGQPKPDLIEILNCSILRLDFLENAWSIGCVNDAAHLDVITAADAG